MIVVNLERARRTNMYWGITIFLIFSFIVALFALDWLDEKELAAIPGQPSTPPAGNVNIVISVSERTLAIYSEGQVYKRYRIAVGKDSTPTPIGEWKIVWKDYNWGTGFGSRWMGLNVPWEALGLEHEITACRYN